MAVDAIATALALSGPTPVAVEQAMCTLEDLIGRLAAEAGGPFAVRLRRAFPAEVLEEAVRAAAARMDAEFPRPAGHKVVDVEQRARAAGMLADELQARLGAPLRRLVWERAALAASLAGVTVDALRAEASLQRVGPGAAVPS